MEASVDTKKKKDIVHGRVTQQSVNVHTLELEYKPGSESIWLCAMSDLHLDSKKCRRDVLRKCLDKAVDRGACIFMPGDILDVMQGRMDKRGNKADVKKEYQTSSYFNDVANECAEFLAPYSNRISLITRGNHESSLMQRAEIDILQMMIDKIAASTGTKIALGGYAGYFRLLFKSQTANTVHQYLIKYYHSSGSYGKRTKGMLGDIDMAVHYKDADIVVTGDNHNPIIHPYVQEELKRNGEVSKRMQWHMHLPAIKDDYADGANGWWIEKHLGPRAVGCGWIEFKVSGIGSSNLESQPTLDLWT